jgi:hypothetical protein
MMQRFFRSTLLVALLLGATSLHAQDTARAIDPRLPQLFSSEYGYSFALPEKAKFNKLGSEIKKAGQTERQNFILSGGSGSITIYHFAEPRMVPKDYKLIDSIHYFDIDSAGRNGMIHRRVYILKEIAVQMDILLTEKGAKEYGDLVEPIFTSFVPPAGAERRLDAWRYGRDPKEFERGRYAPNQGPDRR